MQFVYPSFLFALSAIAVPIIIHLFHFRRYKKIVFSDIRFLKQVEEETKSQQRLKELLILLCRILAIIFLVLAFAQPFIPDQEHTAGQKGSKAVSIFIDNSFSMGAEGKNGTLIEEARNKARAIVNAYGNDDLFQVLTNDFEGVQQRLLSRNDAIGKIDEVAISSATKRLSEIIPRQKQAFEKAGNASRLSYIISDFQRTMADTKAGSDTSVRLTFVPVQAKGLHNVYIDTAWILSPVIRVNEPVKLGIRIRNSGEEAAEDISIALKVNGVQKALQNTDCAAGQYADVEMTFTPSDQSWQNGEISIIDHPITFDDKLSFSVMPEATTRLMCINGNAVSTYVNSVFTGDPAFLLTQANADRLDYSAFKAQQCIILNDLKNISSGLAAELVKYVNEGGLLVVLPSPDPAAAASLNPLLASLSLPQIGNKISQPLKVASLNINDALLRDVFTRIPKNMDLPTVNMCYDLQKTSATSGNALMTLNNGSTFLHQSISGKGKVLLLAAPLDPAWSNLQQHALFVPLMLKAAFGTRKSYRLYYVSGSDKWVTVSATVQGAEKIMRISGNGTDLVSDIRQRNGKNELYIDEQVKNTGIYTVSEKNRTDAPASFFALNYGRSESDTRVLDEDALSALPGSMDIAFAHDDVSVMQQKIMQEISGTRFWRICLLSALLFILIEILLLKLLK